MASTCAQAAYLGQGVVELIVQEAGKVGVEALVS